MHGRFPLFYGDREWRSSEALYQALRFPGETAIHDAINAASNAMEAKRKAYEFIERTRADWQDVKVPNMEKVLRLKCEQHPTSIDAVLEQTFDLAIVEKSKNDPFWGARPDGNGNLVGENVLGILWELMRFERRNGFFVGEVCLEL